MLTLGAPLLARADTTNPTPEISSDGTVDANALRAKLAIELATVDAARRPTRVALTRVNTSWEVQIVFSDGVEFRPVTDTSTDPDAKVRIVALVVAEAVRSHRTKQEKEPELGKPPGIPRPSESRSSARDANASENGALHAQDHDKTTAPSLQFDVDAAFGLRLYEPLGTLTIEPRLTAHVEHRSGVSLGLSAFYTHSKTSDALGDAVVDGFGGGLSLAYRFVSSRALRLRAGPRIDVGAFHGVGTPASSQISGSSATEPFVATVGELTLQTRLFGRSFLSVVVDAGYVAQGIALHADERRIFAAKGFTTGARIGIGFD